MIPILVLVIVFGAPGDCWWVHIWGVLLGMLEQKLPSCFQGEPPLDFTPETGRLVLFWAARLPHEAGGMWAVVLQSAFA